MGTRTDGPPSTTSGAKMLLHFCPVGVTMSWEEAHPGARASRPHKSSRSFAHLLDPDRPATAPGRCVGRAMRFPPAGWPAAASRGNWAATQGRGCGRDARAPGGCRPDGAVGGIRRATSLRAGLPPLGNSRLPASDASVLPRRGGSFEGETTNLHGLSGTRTLSRDSGFPDY